jgi:hypothetical protein
VQSTWKERPFKLGVLFRKKHYRPAYSELVIRTD